jgi:hypothetical protein
MARQQAIFQNAKSIAAAALVGLGLAILFGKVCGPTAQVTNILGFVAREAMQLMPYVVPAAWRALQGYGSDHQGFSPCLLQILVSCWSLVHGLAGAA